MPKVEAKQLVKTAKLTEILSATGIRVEVEEASLDDFRGAEQRACFHLSPQPPDTENDEMRDLIIWEVALRIAKMDGKAVLVSKDHVHTHNRGAEEAAAAGLLRADGWDGAFDLIGKESPIGNVVHGIFSVIWNPVREAGVPLAEKILFHSIGSAEFRSSLDGRVDGSFIFATETTKGRLEARIVVRQNDADEIGVLVDDLRIEGVKWNRGALRINVPGQLPKLTAPAEERLAAVRELIGNKR